MSPDRGRVALVVEGGGMRGAYAAGAILEAHDFLGERLAGIFATSSGASSAAYAASGQREGLGIWKDHVHGRRLVHPARFLVGRAALDVSYLIDTVFGERVPLDVEAVRRFRGPFDVTVTHAETGEAEYLDMHRRPVLDSLRAAVSLPGAVRRPVIIDGVPYVDGGLVDPIPVRRAFEAGFRDIVVIQTRPQGYRKKPSGAFARWLVGRDFPGIRGALRRHHEVYNETLDWLACPPVGVTLHVIRPAPGLALSRWTRSRTKLLDAIEHGTRDARRALDA